MLKGLKHPITAGYITDDVFQSISMKRFSACQLSVCKRSIHSNIQNNPRLTLNSSRLAGRELGLAPPAAV